MAKTTKFPEFLGLPIDQSLKDDLVIVADFEERTPTDMARLALKRWLSDWFDAHPQVKPASEAEAADAKAVHNADRR